MFTLSLDPREPEHPASPGTGASAAPAALARALAGCADIAPRSSIAVIGAAAATCQIALVDYGFLEVTAISQRGAELLREHYDCVCLMGAPSCDDATLASLRRRLPAGGVLVLETAPDTDRVALAARLYAVGFARVQHRVVGLRRAGGLRQLAVFLIARAAQAPDRASSVRRAA